MGITTLTKRLSFDEILRTLGDRQASVLKFLAEWGEAVTANELANYMHQFGYFHTSDRNNVHPRLNELTKYGYVRVSGKRKCSITGKTCATYEVVRGEA